MKDAEDTRKTGNMKDMSESYWKEKLTPEQYKVVRLKGTERAFTGALYNNHETGMYECVACGQPLFSSEHKYDSGSGWPSFDRPLDEGRIELHEDRSFFMTRTEVTCSNCGAHLGHVFDDGPAQTTGQRYCINSVSLKFDPDNEPQK
ncbi:MAG TPA: peptide-methionine (R)-S-oxide reductase MsrB [Ktedonobacteraceae bacterium]|nr:peptide-methionine (R)-S-oxide reductase MsrB [Ktedonobacteraceae bacterium]